MYDQSKINSGNLAFVFSTQKKQKTILALLKLCWMHYIGTENILWEKPNGLLIGINLRLTVYQ